MKLATGDGTDSSRILICEYLGIYNLFWYKKYARIYNSLNRQNNSLGSTLSNLEGKSCLRNPNRNFLDENCVKLRGGGVQEMQFLMDFFCEQPKGIARNFSMEKI